VQLLVPGRGYNSAIMHRVIFELTDIRTPVAVGISIREHISTNLQGTILRRMPATTRQQNQWEDEVT
jgi:hypothetical protein